MSISESFNIKNFDDFIRNFSIADLVNKTKSLVFPLKYSYVFMIYKNSSLALPIKTINKDTDGISEVISFGLQLKEADYNNIKVALYAYNNYSTKICTLESNTPPEKIKNKLFRDISTSKCDIKMSLSSLSSKIINKYKVKPPKAKNRFVHIIIVNSKLTDGLSKEDINNLKQEFISGKTSVFGVTIDTLLRQKSNKVEEILMYNNSEIKDLIQISGKIDEAFTENFVEETDTNFTSQIKKIDKFLEGCRELYISLSITQQRIKNGEISGKKLEKLKKLLFYEYISDNYIQTLLDELDQESLKKMEERCEMFLESVNSLHVEKTAKKVQDENLSRYIVNQKENFIKFIEKFKSAKELIQFVGKRVDEEIRKITNDSVINEE